MKDFISVLSKLQEQTDASKFLNHHEQVRQYYSAQYGKRENLLHFGRGYVYSSKEIAEFQADNKKPIAFPFQRDSIRAYLGAMTQNRPKITFSPVEPSDQAIVDPLKQRLSWENQQLEIAKKDVPTLLDSYLTGVGYQDFYTYVKEGQKKPTTGLSNENLLAIYWDPNSNDVGRRDDAQFFDREKFISLEDLENNFEELAAKGEFEILQNRDEESYEATSKYADRGHEQLDERNGTFKVVERFYRVTKKEHIAHNGDQKVKLEKDQVEAYKQENPDVHIERKDIEYTYIAIACPAWSRTKFLYNGPLHCQPRHPRSGKVLWSVFELVCESIGGEAMGFAEGMQDAVKVANGILTQIYHSARTNSGSGTTFKPDFFKTPKDAKEYEKHGSDPRRHFPLKMEAPADTIAAIPKGTISKEHTEVLNTALSFLEKVSSTPPAMKGQMESAVTSGKLNAQRINQSFIQLQQAQANYSDFCKRRAEYQLAIWVEYNDAYLNENVNIVSKNHADDPDFITFNQLTEEKDEVGNLTGRLMKLNDPTTVQYDVMVEDPYSSPVARQLQIDNLMELLNVPAIQSDPNMVAAICFELLTLIDLPLDSKIKLQQNSAQWKAKQAEQQALEQQQAQVDMAGQQAAVQGQKINNASQVQQMEQAAQMPPEQPPAMAA